jgi:CRISPR-associated endonuclease Csn1
MTEEAINFPERFIGRILSDTRYICREVRGYLRQLYPSDSDENRYVQVVAGGATSNLRHVWGLNSILSDGDADEKNRWDHRHHAIDAIVVALCDRGLFQFISRLAARNREMMKRVLSGLPQPWDGFRDDVNDAVQNIVVSHAPTRRMRGELLEAKAYGPTKTDGIFVIRMPLADAAKDSNIKDIVDPVIKRIVELRLAEHNGNIKEAFAHPLFHKDGKTRIETVRVFVRMSPTTVKGISDSSGRIYKYHPFAGNHHVDIFEHIDTGDRKAILVPRFYVNQRNWKPETQSPEWRKLFSLCANDYVRFRGNDDELKILRIQKMSGGGRLQILARPVFDARSEYIPGSVIQLQGENLKRIVEKLQVDPLGRLKRAGD